MVPLMVEALYCQPRPPPSIPDILFPRGNTLPGHGRSGSSPFRTEGDPRSQGVDPQDLESGPSSSVLRGGLERRYSLVELREVPEGGAQDLNVGVKVPLRRADARVVEGLADHLRRSSDSQERGRVRMAERVRMEPSTEPRGLAECSETLL